MTIIAIFRSLLSHGTLQKKEVLRFRFPIQQKSFLSNNNKEKNTLMFN